MLYEEREIPEMFFMKHFNDDKGDDIKKLKYDECILTKTLSPVLFQNDTMNTFLLKLQHLVALSFDKMNVFKNWKNFMVDKYQY